MGKAGPSATLRRLPDAPHRAARRALPSEPVFRHQMFPFDHETLNQERKFWPQYMEAYEDVLAKTSTQDSPWFVIPSNNKWFRNLAIAQIITKTMDDMNLQLPPTHVDLRDIERHYHAAKQKADAGEKDT
ncbi:MAG: hypothetical protein P1V21_02840 [Rhizobiaceae bacterium]|nr:hypothetical protein [Rhizobiaceae bacterium]